MSRYRRPSSNKSTNSTSANNLILSIAPWNSIKRKGSSTNCGSRKPVAPVSQHSHARSSCTRRKSSWTSSSLSNSSIVCSRTCNCTPSNGNQTHCVDSNRSESSNSSNRGSSCRISHAPSSCSRISTDYAKVGAWVSPALNAGHLTSLVSYTHQLCKTETLISETSF